MTNKEFQIAVNVGDTLTVYRNHGNTSSIQFDDVTFLGYDKSCQGCSDCLGKLKVNVGNGTYNLCARNGNRIRVAIKTTNFLPQNLFEI